MTECLWPSGREAWPWKDGWGDMTKLGCAGRRGCLREGCTTGWWKLWWSAEQRGPGGACQGPVPPFAPPPSSELSGRGLIAVDSSSRLASDLCPLWVSGVINTESHLCGKRLLGIRAQGTSKVLCSPGASEGISQRKTHERVSEFPGSSHRAGGHERVLQRHHGGVGRCWREVGRSLH